MFINKDSLKVNGVLLGKYITNVSYSYNKLWSSDSGRNLAGEQTGTLIGIFPKIIVNFRRLTKAEIEEIAPILDSASQTLSYYDPVKKKMLTITTYTGDWEIACKNIAENEPFDISFIAKGRR